jgi:hypothetical protein
LAGITALDLDSKDRE